MPVEKVDTEVWDTILRVNLRGTMVASRAAIPHLRKRGGAIVNTSSGAALSGGLSHSAYSASKAAINSLTQSLATQHGKEGIRCNAIAPGLIVTPATQDSYAKSEVGEVMLRHHLTPRLGKPEDVAAAVVFLSSDEAAFITGQVICVDGGLHAHQPYVADFMARGGHAVSVGGAHRAHRGHARDPAAAGALRGRGGFAQRRSTWSSCSPPMWTAADGAAAATR